MKLILHIGTAKTGTTALQHFLCVNAKKLREHGIHYATPPNEFNFNSITNTLLLTGLDKFRTFFLNQLKVAERDGAHTIIASSESLYSISALLEERNLIEQLRASIPAEVECRVLCYVRRPDHCLESLYNQNVKRGVIGAGLLGDQTRQVSLFTGDVIDFLKIIEGMLDYHRCLSIWREVFGSSACSVRAYEAALPNLIEDFVRHVLDREDISSFTQLHLRSNERISRDVLEYKRLRHEHITYSERNLERKIFELVDKIITSPNNNHEYLSPDERAALLSRLEPSMERLRTEFSLPPFPRFDLEAASASWQPYPGLSLEKRREIEHHYNAVQRQVGFRLERLLIRAASLTRRRLPFLSWLLDFARGSGIRRLLLEATSRFQ